VVAVDIGTCELLEGWIEGPAAQTGGGSDWENPLAGNGFGALGSPISPRGDRGAARDEEPWLRVENAGRTAGFFRAEGWGREGYP
jgi:hypothetical protein